ncbi:hypothetical protein BB558_004328 [Smittium angustum]|uniref:Uncharacterized protein n=1 Tax=Smittium angustum TaxID=133377 RepID=A0A2U1J3K4_SMIAN|nr:hypothetical protein BB558_006542 [Smittium angustum]PVZ99618.1 hypothetical protein BB558_004328 [Smittium angustum]
MDRKSVDLGVIKRETDALQEYRLPYQESNRRHSDGGASFVSGSTIGGFSSQYYNTEPDDEKDFEDINQKQKSVNLENAKKTAKKGRKYRWIVSLAGWLFPLKLMISGLLLAEEINKKTQPAYFAFDAYPETRKYLV